MVFTVQGLVYYVITFFRVLKYWLAKVQGEMQFQNFINTKSLWPASLPLSRRTSWQQIKQKNGFNFKLSHLISSKPTFFPSCHVQPTVKRTNKHSLLQKQQQSMHKRKHEKPSISQGKTFNSSCNQTEKLESNNNNNNRHLIKAHKKQNIAFEENQ